MRPRVCSDGQMEMLFHLTNGWTHLGMTSQMGIMMRTACLYQSQLEAVGSKIKYVIMQIWGNNLGSSALITMVSTFSERITDGRHDI